MLTLSAAAEAAMAARVTKPLYLVEIDFDPVSRFSTFGDVAWNGLDWSGARSVEVSGLSQSGNGIQSGTVTLGNVDLLIGALVLTQGVASRGVRIWGGDVAALAVGDPVMVFDGVISTPEVDMQRVTLTLTTEGVRTRMSPRRFIGPSAGFSSLIPAGTQIKFGTTVYTLERR